MTDKPFVIGITGNIATGKSVISQMIANSGGFKIDADVIANRMLYPGAPAFQPVIDAFGTRILTDDELISRQQLGQIVFPNPEKLRTLELLIHPFVTEAIKKRICIASQPIVVIEAIKLFESDLVDICDSIWVSHASERHQMARLINNRHLPDQEAKARLQAQPDQSEKLQRANIVINTEGSFKNTWAQVQVALNDTITEQSQFKTYYHGDWQHPDANEFSEETLEDFWRSNKNQEIEDLYQSLGMKGFLSFVSANELKAIILIKNWNFTAAIEQYISKVDVNLEHYDFISAFELYNVKHECEVLLFTNQMAKKLSYDLLQKGYEHQEIRDIPYPAWQEAAKIIIENENDKNIWIKYLQKPIEALSSSFIKSADK